MSDHTLCDKCSKPIDKSQPYQQVVVTELAEVEGTPTVQTSVTIYDYHANHVPKFEKGKLPGEEPAPEQQPT